MSDAVWQALIAAVVTVILAYMSHQTKTAVDRASVKAEVGVDRVSAHHVETAEKVDTVHVLVNSQRTEMLRELAEVRRRLATLTGSIEDIAAAETAEKRAKGA